MNQIIEPLGTPLMGPEPNYDAIMAGEFSGSLCDASPMGAIFKEMEALSRDEVFTARRKTELEVSGRRLIENVMSGIMPVFADLAANDWSNEKLKPHNVQLIRALDLDIRHVADASQALHALADYTSGMTDRYAVRIARMLSGI